MHNLIIRKSETHFSDHEIEKLKNYVKKRNGKILWGMYDKEEEEYLNLYWVSRSGFMATPFKDVK